MWLRNFNFLMSVLDKLSANITRNEIHKISKPHSDLPKNNFIPLFCKSFDSVFSEALKTRNHTDTDNTIKLGFSEEVFSVVPAVCVSYPESSFVWFQEWNP